MLNGLAVFNRVGLAHFYDKSCLNGIQISYCFKSGNYDDHASNLIIWVIGQYVKWFSYFNRVVWFISTIKVP